MPKREDVKKVLVIGSGPIVIGQAAEFDYAGTQACRALSEEGVEVVLINSNPATIMTDKMMADKIYIEPLVADSVKRVIEIEKPDSILPTLGGQTGLNLAMELAEEGYLDKFFEGNGDRVYVAEADGKVIGYISIEEHPWQHRLFSALTSHYLRWKAEYSLLQKVFLLVRLTGEGDLFSMLYQKFLSLFRKQHWYSLCHSAVVSGGSRL